MRKNLCWRGRATSHLVCAARVWPQPLGAAMAADAPPPNYEWTQTKEELTITVALPAGTSSAQISVACAKTTLAIGLKGAAAPLVAGELHEAVADSVWSLERGGALTLELEKARPRWWPCALKGGPEVDVQALVAREKAEREPAFKADPSAEAAPRQITDREQLRALKAQFPHLNIKVDGDLHSTEHKNYTGARQAFDWGAVPAVAAEAAAAPAPARAPAPAPATVPPSAEPSAAPPPVAAEAGGAFQWGALPAASAPAPAATGLYTWGALPPD